MSIPRILVQTHVHPSWIDAQNNTRHTMQKLRKMNPSWKHMYFNPYQARAFIAQSMPASVLRAYDALSPQYGPAQADLFRYVAMYALGGVYLDCKCSCLVPLDVLLQRHARVASGPLLGHWSTRHHPQAKELNYPRGECVNWALAAPPRHPLFRRVIDGVVARIEQQLQLPASEREVGKPGVLRITGPIAFTRIILQHQQRSAQHIHPSVFDLGLRYRPDGHPDARQRTHYCRLSTPIVRSPPPSPPEAAAPCGDDDKSRQRVQD